MCAFNRIRRILLKFNVYFYYCIFKSIHFSWAYNPLAALGTLKQESYHDFEVNLGYRERDCLLRKNKTKQNKILETNAFHHVTFILIRNVIFILIRKIRGTYYRT